MDTYFSVNGHCYGNAQPPRRVSLHLYDENGQLMIEPTFLSAKLYVPTYVDFHLSELELYRIAAADGYHPVENPPDWSQFLTAEAAILREFMP